jgi:hypothetical protein
MHAISITLTRNSCYLAYRLQTESLVQGHPRVQSAFAALLQSTTRADNAYLYSIQLEFGSCLTLHSAKVIVQLHAHEFGDCCQVVRLYKQGKALKQDAWAAQR